MIRIHADFNSMDEQGRVWLDTAGSLRDIAACHDSLVDGLRVVLDVPGEFEVEATLIFDKAWRAVPDLSTLRYVDGATDT